MLAQSLSPFSMQPEALDHYLERGWFRMGQTIFTTNFLFFKQQLYSAVWLRVDLEKFTQTATQRKLYKQNATFRIEIGPAVFNDEKEELYRKYRQSIPFDASSSIHQLMFGSTSFNIYNTFEVCLYDKQKLVGCGFFDFGHTTAAGITSFYDPDYKKASLGKYMIFIKMDHCKSMGIRYFYPGYFVPGYPPFDYKLQFTRDALDFLDLATNRWLRIENFKIENTPYQEMTERITKLKNALDKFPHQLKVWHYSYFDANILIDIDTAHFLDYPLFISNQYEDEIRSVVVFNVATKKYEFIACQVFQLSNTVPQVDMVSGYLLKREKVVFASASIEDVVLVLTTEFGNFSGIKSKREPA